MRGRDGSRLRRPLSIAALGLVAALLSAQASSAAEPEPLFDIATAAGDNVIVDDFSATAIEVDARSGPSGENPEGHVSFMAGQILPISGPVTCLDVSGNTAVMTVAGPFPARPLFTSFIVRLTDNGGGGADRFEYYPNDPAVSEVLDCRLDSPHFFGGALTGRAVVVDAADGNTCARAKRAVERARKRRRKTARRERVAERRLERARKSGRRLRVKRAKRRLTGSARRRARAEKRLERAKRRKQAACATD